MVITMYKLFGGYRFPYCLREIKNIPHAIKYRFQRAYKGFADCDTWSLDNYFIEVMKPALKYFKENQNGHPYDLTEEEWNSILDRMIFLLSEMDVDTCSQQNEYYENTDWVNDFDEETRKKAVNRTIEIDKYIDSCKDEFFKLFSEYFYSLWD